jgi:hypothetical protein
MQMLSFSQETLSFLLIREEAVLTEKFADDSSTTLRFPAAHVTGFRFNIERSEEICCSTLMQRFSWPRQQGYNEQPARLIQRQKLERSLGQIQSIAPTFLLMV